MQHLLCLLQSRSLILLRKVAEIATQRANGNTETPLLLNPDTEKIFCRKMATLLEAFASADGIPMNISNGSVINEPPPAMVFKNPENSPAPPNKNPSANDIYNLNSVSLQFKLSEHLANNSLCVCPN